MDEKHTLERIHYFSAEPSHLPNKIGRHRLYMQVLRASGVEVHLGRFKEKKIDCPYFLKKFRDCPKQEGEDILCPLRNEEIGHFGLKESNCPWFKEELEDHSSSMDREENCPLCYGRIIRHEEKETDVWIASKLFEVCYKQEGDIILVVTGDTDMMPAIGIAKRLFEETERVQKKLFVPPIMRVNRDLTNLAPESFGLRLTDYENAQFPDPVTFPNGSLFTKPHYW